MKRSLVLYLKLLRVKHYIKNFIVLLPIFFAEEIFERDSLIKGLAGTAAFCLVSSVVYIFNDLLDKERDQKHPTKCKRPIASGNISERAAKLIMVILLLASCALLIAMKASVVATLFLASYLAINIIYSLGCKNIPIVDIIMLASGYPIRLLFGGSITNIVVSPWLFLMVLCVSLYLGIGKRYGELKQVGEKACDLQNIRPVLLKYDISYLNKQLYMFLSLSLVFYSLWTIERAEKLVYTVPVVMIIALRYNWLLEKKDGDPVEMILKDLPILIISIFYALVLMILIYSL